MKDLPEIVANGRLATELVFLHPSLRLILVDLLKMWEAPQLAITSIYRSEEENKAALAKSRIHVVGPPYRALDVRVRNLPGEFQEKAEKYAQILNERWVYDPKRLHLKVAIAKLHGSGPHVHCQVHPRTERR